MFPGTSLASRTDSQVARIVAVNGTHRLPDALAPLINVRSGAEGDKQTPNVTKCQVTRGHSGQWTQMVTLFYVGVCVVVPERPRTRRCWRTYDEHRIANDFSGRVR